MIMVFLTNLIDTEGIDVRCIHCDNADKNKAFEMLCKQEGMGIKFEYIMFSTPQQNGQFEGKFAIEYKLCLMMGSSLVFWRNGLWAEAADTATLLKNNTLTNSRELSPFLQLCKGNRNVLSLLQKLRIVHHEFLQ